MPYNITFSQDAEEDIFSAYVWYEQQRVGLGDEFKNAVKEAAAAIQSNPLLYGFRKKNIRGCNVKRFPYLILFLIETHNIRVIYISHTGKKTHK